MPPFGSYNFKRRDDIVDFPEPEWPTIAKLDPGRTVKFKFVKIETSSRVGYANDTKHNANSNERGNEKSGREFDDMSAYAS